jgi:neopullulanase
MSSSRSLLLAALVIGCGSSSNNEQPADAGEDVFVPGLDTGAETTPDPDAPSMVPLRSCRTVFEYASTASTSVEVAGEWDGFKTKTPLVAAAGKYRAELDLPKGDYAYKLIIGGEWQLDPSHGRRKYVGGVENSRVLVDDCQFPRLRLDKFEAKADGTINIIAQYLDGSGAKGIGALTAKSKTLTVNPTVTNGQLVIAIKGAAKGKHTIVIDAIDKAGHPARPLTIPTWIEDEPFQWSDGPMYFVFTDRFRNGSTGNDLKIAGIDDRANYLGGDFAGIKQAIDEGYFDKLGVRSLWLSPVNANTNKKGKGSDGRDYSGYHGYWPTEPRQTEEHFGTLDELRAVTAAAHAHGIRVVFDLVQNQVHEDHAYVTAHKSEGWFNGDGSCVCGGPSCSWDDRPVDCWFTSYLPDVNWTTTAAQDAFVEDSIWWLTEADADGFRVDAVKHMNDVASTALRTEIRDRLELGNARYYLVGETFTGGDDGGRALIKKYVGPNALWGQFDFPLFWAIDYAFAQNAGSMANLEAAIAKSDTSYGPGAVMSPFLGNHDVTRFLSRAAGHIGSNPQEQAWVAPPGKPTSDEPYDRAFLAFAVLLGQPGVPLIYYGDEVGLPGTADPDNRRFYPSTLDAREQKLLDRVRILARARGTHKGLMRGARKWLHDDGDGYVFARGTGAELAIVAVNRGTTARTITVKISGEDGTLKDLLGGPSITIKDGSAEVPLTPRGAALYIR